MSRLRQSVFYLAAATAAITVMAQTPSPFPARISAAATNIFPPLPSAYSPVNFFRQLLAMSPAERFNSLTNRTPEVRIRILAKVHEYQVLGPDERELRLRATELRWYLTPLFRIAPADRAARLAQVPEELRGIVLARLLQWDSLPPALQQEFLANENTLHYFAHVEATNNPAAGPGQTQIADQFNQFFELTPDEKTRLLNTLSEAERAQMEKTLKSFGQLPALQRLQCVRNYAKFAGMSDADRAEFLKNAENWSKMSPKERQTWRDLVAHVPQWPPMPPPIVPPYLVPHALPKPSRPNMATNLN
jgi:hypothetical protein